MTVCRNLETRFDVYIDSLAPLLSSTGSSTGDSSSQSSSPHIAFNSLIAEGSGATLMHLLQLKNGLSGFEVTLRETASALRDLLENDEDMAEMYLSLKRSGGLPKQSEHEEVELILETYLRKVDELENEVEQNVKSITLTEEHIQIRLDSVRNSIMKLELLVSICALGVTSAALGAGLFGMNIPNHLEHSPYAFFFVTGCFIGMAFILIRQGISICNRRGINLFQIESQDFNVKFPVSGSYNYYSAIQKAAGAEATKIMKQEMKQHKRRMSKFGIMQPHSGGSGPNAGCSSNGGSNQQAPFRPVNRSMSSARLQQQKAFYNRSNGKDLNSKREFSTMPPVSWATLLQPRRTTSTKL
jgi:hypothetical protein